MAGFYFLTLLCFIRPLILQKPPWWLHSVEAERKKAHLTKSFLNLPPMSTGRLPFFEGTGTVFHIPWTVFPVDPPLGAVLFWLVAFGVELGGRSCYSLGWESERIRLLSHPLPLFWWGGGPKP